MTQKWIDEQSYEYDIGPTKDGEMGFLIRISNENTGSDRYILRCSPPYTNRSNKPRLYGWCGTNNNVGTYGEGVWKITRIAKNGRTLIEEVEAGDERDAFLEEMGYPDLTDED